MYYTYKLQNSVNVSVFISVLCLQEHDTFGPLPSNKDKKVTYSHFIIRIFYQCHIYSSRIVSIQSVLCQF